MRTLFIYFITGLSCISCNNSFSGLYKHEICGSSPDCFLYDFCENGRFTYWYSQDLIGSKTLTGNWVKNSDTLILYPDKYIFETKTNVLTKRDLLSDSCIIKIGLLPKYFKNQRDTTLLKWLVVLNDDDKTYETNDKGVLVIPYQPIEKVMIKDIFMKYGLSPIVNPTDSIFSFEGFPNEILIYIADNKTEPMILGVNERMLIKRRRLISISSDSLVNLPADKYLKVKRKCGNI